MKWQALPAFALVIAHLGSARADDNVKNACSDAYELTQTTRAAQRLRAAHGHALACARAECPEILASECTRWLGEIDASLPTIVVEARTAAGADVTIVRVRIDGEIAAESAAGTAIQVDPGEHVFRFEAVDRTAPDQRIVVREGEKNRRITVVLQAARPLAPAPAPAPSSSGPPTASYVLGGVGLVGLGMFTTFGLLGRSEQGDLEDTCEPRCTEDQIGSVETKFAVADVALGVGLVALGVAAVSWIIDEPEASPSPPAPAPPSSRAAARVPSIAIAF